MIIIVIFLLPRKTTKRWIPVKLTDIITFNLLNWFECLLQNKRKKKKKTCHFSHLGACSKINMVDFFIFLPFIMEDSFVSVNYFHNCLTCNEVSKFLCFFLSFPFGKGLLTGRASKM